MPTPSPRPATSSGARRGDAPSCSCSNRFDHPNASTFDARQARAYLSEVLVPLVVWRIGPAEVGPEWPEGRVIANLDELRRAFEALVRDVGRQRIAWLEGTRDLRYSGSQVAPGIVLAGRSAPSEFLESPPEPAEPAERAAALGPWGGEVHALAAARDGALVYAGTHAGVFRSTDGGRTWEAAGRGLPPAPVRSLALCGRRRGRSTRPPTPDSSEAKTAETAGEAFRAPERRCTRRASRSTAEVPSASTSARAAAASSGAKTAGRRFSGRRSLAATIRSLAVDPRDATVWAATENGLFRSADRGSSWAPAPGVSATVLGARRGSARPDLRRDGRRRPVREPGRRRVLAGDEARERLPDRRGRGLERARAHPRLLAGRCVLVSRRRRILEARAHRSGRGALTDRRGRLGGRRAAAESSEPNSAGKGWSPSNAGLAAASVFSLASLEGPRPVLVAGTARGMLRSVAGDPWKRVPGTPESVEFYALAPASRNPSNPPPTSSSDRRARSGGASAPRGPGPGCPRRPSSG